MSIKIIQGLLLSIIAGIVLVAGTFYKALIIHDILILLYKGIFSANLVVFIVLTVIILTTLIYVIILNEE